MIMKTLIRTFILFFCITGLASCYAGIPLKSGKSENNQTYEVSYLFEHDGVKVYRFLDLGNYVYFTTRGDVTSIKNDSTRKRTITIYIFEFGLLFFYLYMFLLHSSKKLYYTLMRI